MSSRVLTESDRQRRLAERRLHDLAARHAAIAVISKSAREGTFAGGTERAICLIEALVRGHALARWEPTLNPQQQRLTIVAADSAPPEVRGLLEQAQLPKLDPAEQSMLKAIT